MDDEQITFNDDGHAVAVKKLESGGFQIVVNGAINTASINLNWEEFAEFYMDVRDFYKRGQ